MLSIIQQFLKAIFFKGEKQFQPTQTGEKKIITLLIKQ